MPDVKFTAAFKKPDVHNVLKLENKGLNIQSLKVKAKLLFQSLMYDKSVFLDVEILLVCYLPNKVKEQDIHLW
jgi:hypothetical protein